MYTFLRNFAWRAVGILGIVLSFAIAPFIFLYFRLTEKRALPAPPIFHERLNVWVWFRGDKPMFAKTEADAIRQQRLALNYGSK